MGVVGCTAQSDHVGWAGPLSLGLEIIIMLAAFNLLAY